MTTDRERQLREVLDISRRMQGLARAGSWEELIGLERERRSMIHSCFGPTVLPHPEAAAAVIEEIMTVDKEIVAHIAKARDEVAEMLAKVKHGRSASRAYNACERQR
ncbi:MAG TPA: flagellar protein FliT [Chromatiales bacterium]|nr:flagellar protein FliT [Chromatiales bacterium]